MENIDYKNDLNEAVTKSIDWLQAELRGLKTGRATPSLVENIQVDCYGAKMPIIQLASVTAPEANMLIIKPWDQNNLKPINKVLQESDLGATCSLDGDLIRLRFAQITEERRLELVKKLKEKLETAKVRIKQARDKIREQVTKSEQNGETSEDQKYTAYEEIDELTKKGNESLKNIADKKEQEIMTI